MKDREQIMTRRQRHVITTATKTLKVSSVHYSSAGSAVQQSADSIKIHKILPLSSCPRSYLHATNANSR
jgi:hypothetical protein